MLTSLALPNCHLLCPASRGEVRTKWLPGYVRLTPSLPLFPPLPPPLPPRSLPAPSPSNLLLPLQFVSYSLNSSLMLLERFGLETESRRSPVHVSRTCAAMVMSVHVKCIIACWMLYYICSCLLSEPLLWFVVKDVLLVCLGAMFIASTHVVICCCSISSHTYNH